MSVAARAESNIRERLLDKRHKLEAARLSAEYHAELEFLLREVDSALDRLDKGTYGLCEVCHDPVEDDRLAVDPLTRFCIDHLTPSEQRALEEDLSLASRIQQGLLPKSTLQTGHWEVSYHYQPAGPVSGDYCDLVSAEDGSLYFVLGDVSGKGVGASMLMAHLHAMFRSLILIGMPLDRLVERASRLFCESTLPSQYATLVCGKTQGNDEVEICNAGHLPPLLLSDDRLISIEATGLPLGLFGQERFSSKRFKMPPGSMLLLYTDGLSETFDGQGNEYGSERISRVATRYRALGCRELIDKCLDDVGAFRQAVPYRDDLTIMALRRQ
jgi:sigma-B regulation protein RsbU (phosphoserine phosphatase)